MAVVYLIEDLTNGYCYIGKTVKDPGRYWAGHIKKASRGCKHRPLLYRAMRMHGAENFRFTVVEWHDTDDQAQQSERYWIERLDLNRSANQSASGYNLTGGGDGHSGYTQSLETKLRRAESRRRNGKKVVWSKPSPLKGRPMSQEAREKMSLAKRGKPSPFLGKRHTAASREKLSQALMGRSVWNKGVPMGPMPERQRLRMSASRKGKHTSSTFKKGQLAHNATPDEVVSAILASAETNRTLGARFGIHHKTVERIRRRHRK